MTKCGHIKCAAWELLLKDCTMMDIGYFYSTVLHVAPTLFCFIEQLDTIERTFIIATLNDVTEIFSLLLLFGFRFFFLFYAITNMEYFTLFFFLYVFWFSFRPVFSVLFNCFLLFFFLIVSLLIFFFILAFFFIHPFLFTHLLIYLWCYFWVFRLLRFIYFSIFWEIDINRIRWIILTKIDK